LVQIWFKKTQIIQTFHIRSDGFPRETVHNPQFKFKVKKLTLLAFNVHIKKVSKHDQNTKTKFDILILLCNYITYLLSLLWVT